VRDNVNHLVLHGLDLVLQKELLLRGAKIVWNLQLKPQNKEGEHHGGGGERRVGDEEGLHELVVLDGVMRQPLNQLLQGSSLNLAQLF